VQRTDAPPVVLVEITLPEDTPTVEPSATPLFTHPVTPYAHIQDINLDERKLHGLARDSIDKIYYGFKVHLWKRS
jgi:hypothetical protein